MKIMKRIIVLCGVISLLSILHGCGLSFDKPPFSYSFRQERSNISSIEICTYEHEYDKDGGTMTPLAEIATEDIDAFLDDLQALDCYETALMLDTPMGYGKIVVKIMYNNGDGEIIGTENVGWLHSDKTLELTKYYFYPSDLCSVITKYADIQILVE